MSKQECLALLGRAPIGRVALSIAAMPAVRSVKFVVADANVVLRLAPDSRLSRAAAGSVIAFHVDHYDHEAREGWSVVVQGVGEHVRDQRLLAALQQLPLDPWSDPPSEDRFVRIPLTEINGEHVRWPPAAPTGPSTS